jgi:hypothetical protein
MLQQFAAAVEQQVSSKQWPAGDSPKQRPGAGQQADVLLPSQAVQLCQDQQLETDQLLLPGNCNQRKHTGKQLIQELPTSEGLATASSACRPAASALESPDELQQFAVHEDGKQQQQEQESSLAELVDVLD